MVTNKNIELTKEGVDKLNVEYRELIDIERPKIYEALQNARGMGDLSENADYDTARDRQAEVEGRIKEIESILANAKIVDVKKNDKSISIGKTITVSFVKSGLKKVFQLVSSQESDALTDPKKIKVSNVSPVGAALLGHKVGDVVTIDNVANPYDVEIVDVKVTQ
jgi:transcription elongation factor GreA